MYQSRLTYSFLLLAILMVSCKKNEELKKREGKLSAKEIYSENVNNTVTVVTPSGLGSGFFVDTDLIITNYHVIKGDNKAEIILNNSAKKIPVLGYLSVDIINDIVLLKIDYKNETFLKLENKVPQTGEKVFAIGSPVGLNKTISEGIVSGIRSFETKNLLQITTPISHGSSGCPIINEYGKLVGVAVGGVEEANNIGFCIPTNYIKSLIDFKESYPKELTVLNINNPHDSDNRDDATNDSINSINSKNQSENTINKAISNSLNKNEIDKVYIGKHLFGAFTIGNDKSFGVANITFVNGIYFIDAYQENEKGHYIKLNGRIVIENINKFSFTGKITVNSPGYDSKTKSIINSCEWNGKAFFENKGGKYWRCQGNSNGNLELCWSHTSYIDIFVPVNPNYKKNNK